MSKREKTALQALLETGPSTESAFLLATTHENERPLLGLSGELDWALHGELSKLVRSHRITGKALECAYVPVRRHDHIYHLLLIGRGQTERPGQRSALPADAWKLIKKNLKGLKAKKVIVSAQDLGGVSESTLQKELGDYSPWIGP